MASKLIRKLQKVFASSASINEIAKFGSLSAAAPVRYSGATADPDDVQELSQFLDGWVASVDAGNSPAIEDVNALHWLVTRQLAYIYQQGVPEWETSTEYFIGSIVNVAGVLYYSLTDNNIGNATTDDTNWRPISGEVISLDASTNSPYVMTANDSGRTFLVDSSTDEMIFELPAPVKNFIFTVKDASKNFSLKNCTIERDGSEEIDGVAANLVLDVNVGSYTLFSDGTNWFSKDNLGIEKANNDENKLILQNQAMRRWESSSSAADNSWQGIAWSPELNLFAAVSGVAGVGNRVMTSPDGVLWTSQTSAADAIWYDVCWSPEESLFVAVADNSGSTEVMTSPDGTTWTLRVGITGSVWYSVCWSAEESLFVAVASSGTDRVMTSPDGITWTARTAATANDWRSVTWAKELNLFVAVGSTGVGNRVMTSPDGITWTARTSAQDNSWQSVCWSPELNLLVAVGSTMVGNRVMTSVNGVDWLTQSGVSFSPNSWESVCWAKELGLFIAVSDTGTGDRVMTSVDGVNWKIRASATDNSWQSVCWSPELSLAVAVANTGTGDRVMTSR